MSNLTTDTTDNESTDPLTCDVTGCDQPALVRVLPTHGETDDEPLRCRECLEYDLGRDWFQDWRKQERPRPDGGTVPRRFTGDCECGRRVSVPLPATADTVREYGARHDRRPAARWLE